MIQELLLTTRQKAKIRNVFANGMSTDIKLGKGQIPKITKSGGSFRSWISNLGKKSQTTVAISFARDDFPE